MRCVGPAWFRTAKLPRAGGVAAAGAESGTVLARLGPMSPLSRLVLVCTGALRFGKVTLKSGEPSEGCNGAETGANESIPAR